MGELKCRNLNGGVRMENQREMPLGLAFQMSMNDQAMKNFAKMTEDERQRVLENARNTRSKSEMQRIVADLGKIR